MKPTDIRLVDCRYSTTTYQYRAPMKFGGRVVTDVRLAEVVVAVRSQDGRSGRGFGAMPLGNVWAWPSQVVPAETTLDAIDALARRIAHRAGELKEIAHPLELTHLLAPSYAELAREVEQEMGLAEPMPVLAQLVAASPVEAALYDGYGKALGHNSYELFGPDFVSHDLARYLSPEFAGEHLDRYTLRRPRGKLPLYHLVGALDPLAVGDLPQRLDDGLPETLGEWILADGLTHLKIKLAGDDLRWDVERVLGVERAAVVAQGMRGCREWHYSLDFNEKCPNVEYILDFLAQVQERSPAAFARVQYIEQPTHRDLRAHPENRMHRAAAIKPVVIDESLTGLDTLLLAREQGYTGVALKACKGHSEALLMGAAAQKFGMFLCVQDLTCIGRSFLHSASIAARLPTVAAIEGNGRQYCPAGNAPWHAKYPSMFHLRDGAVGTFALDGPGLGYE